MEILSKIDTEMLKDKLYKEIIGNFVIFFFL